MWLLPGAIKHHYRLDANSMVHGLRWFIGLPDMLRTWPRDRSQATVGFQMLTTPLPASCFPSPHFVNCLHLILMRVPMSIFFKKRKRCTSESGKYGIPLSDNMLMNTWTPSAFFLLSCWQGLNIAYRHFSSDYHVMPGCSLIRSQCFFTGSCNSTKLQKEHASTFSLSPFYTAVGSW